MLVKRKDPGPVSPEHNTLQVEWILDDARGGDSNPQHILLGWQVAWVSDPVQCIQVATRTERRDHDVHQTYDSLLVLPLFYRFVVRES